MRKRKRERESERKRKRERDPKREGECKENATESPEASRSSL